MDVASESCRNVATRRDGATGKKGGCPESGRQRMLEIDDAIKLLIHQTDATSLSDRKTRLL